MIDLNVEVKIMKLRIRRIGEEKINEEKKNEVSFKFTTVKRRNLKGKMCFNAEQKTKNWRKRKKKKKD